MYKDIIGHPQGEPLTGTYWFKDTQICVARDTEGKSDGFFFAAKAETIRKAITITMWGRASFTTMPCRCLSMQA